jgi:hypothetical protein
MRVKDRGRVAFPAADLEPGDHLLMCEHLVKEYYCRVVRSARIPEENVYVGKGGRVTREDGTQGEAKLAIRCTRTEIDLWEVTWDGARLKITDFEKVA